MGKEANMSDDSFEGGLGLGLGFRLLQWLGCKNFDQVVSSDSVQDTMMQNIS